MNKKLLIVSCAIIVLVAGLLFLLQRDKNSSQDSNELSPVSSITHGHGLAVDVTDPSRVFIATHHGLLVLVDDKDLYRVGNTKDDYMGFSAHPTDSKIFFSSGHPSSGGNIGFQKSEDGGLTWKKISDGVDGPVDFHAMAVSPINPNLIYGWYRGALQRSIDEGKSWELVGKTEFPIIGLTADPKDESVVYAASPQGFMVSKDKGKEWTSLLDGLVSTIAINPQDSQMLISYSEKHRFARSDDVGQTWGEINTDLAGETPLFISFSRQTPETIYLLTEKNSLHKSNDNGLNWSKVR